MFSGVQTREASITYDPVNVWRLAVVNSYMVIKSVNSIRNARNSLLPAQTQDRVEI
jgi:hypothetical protein